MSNDQLVIIIGFFGIVIPASVALIVGFLTYRNNASKQELEETNTRFEALKDMVTLSREEIDRLKSQVKEQRNEIEYLRREIDEKDGSIAHLKAWAADLVNALQVNKIPVPPMPEREKTKPR